METFTLPNGEKVEFIPESHTYLIRGKILPSITGLLTRIHGDKYKCVDPEILERSAEYGTKVHKEIQDLIEVRNSGFDIDNFILQSTQETQNYFNVIEPKYGLEPLMTEVVVVLYDRENNPIAAGRFDLVCKDTINKNTMLCDFKTTSTISTSLVSDQLNLYKRAAEQSGYFSPNEIKSLAVIHLSGEQCRLKMLQIFGEKFFDRYIEAAKQTEEL